MAVMGQWRVVIVLWGIVMECKPLWQNWKQLHGTGASVMRQWSIVVEYSGETVNHLDGRVEH